MECQLKKSANFATYPGQGRLQALRRAVDSIINQVDVVRIYWNEYKHQPQWFATHPKIKNVFGAPNISDLGKFHFLTPNELYFCCDDDIRYPADYVAKTPTNVPVSTYHGRVLNPFGNPKSYYRGGHWCYSFLDQCTEPVQLHVPGTGVMCINTSLYLPTIPTEPHGMADLVFALTAARDEVPIYLNPHPGQWLKNIYTPESITSKFSSKSSDESQQILLVKEIINIFGL
jgi:hypothetical protein